MGFSVVISYEIKKELDKDHIDSILTRIVKKYFKDDVSQYSWERISGASDSLCLVKRNRFTEIWYLVKTDGYNSAHAVMITKIIMFRYGDLLRFHRNENGFPDSIYRGKKEVVSIRNFLI